MVTRTPIQQYSLLVYSRSYHKRPSRPALSVPGKRYACYEFKYELGVPCTAVLLRSNLNFVRIRHNGRIHEEPVHTCVMECSPFPCLRVEGNGGCSALWQVFACASTSQAGPGTPDTIKVHRCTLTPRYTAVPPCVSVGAPGIESRVLCGKCNMNRHEAAAAEK